MTTPSHGHHTSTAQPQQAPPGTAHAQPCTHVPQITPAAPGPGDPHPAETTPSAGHALIGLGSTLVLVLGILVGTGAGILTYLAQHNAATAALAGGAAFAGSVLFFHNIIAG